MPSAFVPVLAPRFPVDELLVPYMQRVCGRALISVPELLRAPRALPTLPLWVDSGGFALLSPGVTCEDDPADGTGHLRLPTGVRITPQIVFALQAEHATVGFTLDFPSSPDTSDGERAHRHALSLANARWAFQQPRSFQLYASVQPGQDLKPVLALNPDGVALGGLAPFSRNRAHLTEAVQQVRAALPAEMPLHVFGIGHPESVRAVRRAGADTVDSSSPQRYAASGRTWTGKTLDGPAPHERLSLAVRNLAASAHAADHPNDPDPNDPVAETPTGRHP